jgi:hypothetical protein
MNVKSVGSATMKAGNALESLGRTDDMLAVIGIIMLVGVIVSSYGAFWQGRLAAAQFKDKCSCEPGQTGQIEHAKTLAYTIGTTVVSILIVTLIIYIFRKQFSDKFSSK